MSQIAALLLMYLNEDEDAFWGLSQLMSNEKYNMHGFFIPQFPKLQRLQENHDKVCGVALPSPQKNNKFIFVDLAEEIEAVAEASDMPGYGHRDLHH